MSCKKNGEPSLGYTLEHAPPVSTAWDHLLKLYTLAIVTVETKFSRSRLRNLTPPVPRLLFL